MDQYFKSYEELEVHRLMLGDKSRLLAYRRAIFNWDFSGKTVMDVGAGTGILSIFCIQAGAKKVYAVEASDLAYTLKQVLIENNVQNKVEVIHSKVEDIPEDSVEKVDIIISEWMGFYLLHEAMLDSVIFARDHFLQKDGLLFPCSATLYVAPCQLESMYDFWDNIHGVNMSCVGKEYRKNKSMAPELMFVKQEDILAQNKLIATLDLNTITKEELDLVGGSEYVVVCNKSGRYQGVCIWFSVKFPDGTVLSTGPHNERTHWKQSIIVLPTEMEVSEFEPIAFKLAFKRETSNTRRYTIEVNILDENTVEHEMPCSCFMTKCIVASTCCDQLETLTSGKELLDSLE